MGVLEGKVAIVTGGGRGIGASVTRAFVREGARVVVNDLGSTEDGTGLSSGPATDIAAELNANGVRVIADGGDIADVATGERLVATAVESFGRLDTVVNVAGILRDRMIFNLTEQDWDAVIRVHMKGTYSTVRPASAYWREQRNENGHYRIINFTSTSGLHGAAGQPNYAAAKMGIVGLTLSLAHALGKYGVTANSISPGAVTRLVAGAGGTPDDERVASPDNVATLAVYLASERSDWLSGRVLSAAGFRVGLYNVPEQIATVESETPWEVGDLADEIEHAFRPLADGAPPIPGNPWAAPVLR